MGTPAREDVADVEALFALCRKYGVTRFCGEGLEIEFGKVADATEIQLAPALTEEQREAAFEAKLFRHEGGR